MIYIFFIGIGYFFSLTGLTYVICYMNLLEIGYNMEEYINFIIRRGECLILPIGIVIMILTILLKRGDDK